MDNSNYKIKLASNLIQMFKLMSGTETGGIAKISYRVPLSSALYRTVL